MASDSFEARLARAAAWTAEASHLVVFTGAGISTDSGIPDYRGPDGVWTRRDAGLPPPSWKVPPDQVRPNSAHLALVALQKLNKLGFLISQNVDDLHLQSGIELDRIAELHGNKNRMKCLACDRRYSLAPRAPGPNQPSGPRGLREDQIVWEEGFGKGYRTDQPVPGQPACACGGRIISSVVNFGDPMPEREMALATDHSRRCDLFFAIGSSLTVTPAAYFPVDAVRCGARLVIVNREPTPLDELAALVFREGIGEVLPALVERVTASAG